MQFGQIEGGLIDSQIDPISGHIIGNFHDFCTDGGTDQDMLRPIVKMLMQLLYFLRHAMSKFAESDIALVNHEIFRLE